MALFQLIYVSALQANGSEMLPGILDSALRNNARTNITGMLLCSDGNVMQALEGEKAAVLETFRRIERDVRHTSVLVLIESEIHERQFASWSMGFKQLPISELEKLPGGANVFKAGPSEVSTRARAGDALDLLNSFVM